MKYRIVKNNNIDNEYYVQSKYIFGWRYIRKGGFLGVEGNPYSCWQFYLTFLCPILWTLFGLIVQPIPTPLTLTLFLLALCSSIYTPLYFILAYVEEGLKKEKFYNEKGAKEFVLKKEKQYKNIKEKRNISIVASFIDGKYIDGKQFERSKKIKRILK